MKKTLIKHLPLVILGSLSGCIFVSLFILSFLNQPIADDVSYFRFFEFADAGHFIYWHYFDHTGRLLQSLLVSIGYLLAGAGSVKLMPFVLYILLVLVMTWASHQLIPWKKRALLQSIISGSILSGAVILLMPSVYDSYLWWTSSSIYLASLIFVVFDICVIYSLLKKKYSFFIELLLLFLVILGQTLSEITSVISIGACGLTLFYYVLLQDTQKIKTFLKMFSALVIGFLLTYLSPGSVGRRASEDGGQIGFDFVRIFILSTKHTFELIASLSLWEITLMALVGLCLSLLIKPFSKKNIKVSLLAIAALMIIGIYGSFCVNNYVWYNMPYRALTLPSFALTISLIGLSVIGFSVLSSTFKNHHLSRSLLTVVCLLLLIPSAMGIVRQTTLTASFMEKRNEAYPTREDKIEDQLESGVNPIKIEALPILVKSQATDLLYKADEQIIWYKEALKGHNGIPESTPISVVAPPEDYCSFGRQHSGECTNLDDTTLFRRAIRKVNNFLIYYLSTEY